MEKKSFAKMLDEAIEDVANAITQSYAEEPMNIKLHNRLLTKKITYFDVRRMYHESTKQEDNTHEID